jgi:hypothetical protein
MTIGTAKMTMPRIVPSTRSRNAPDGGRPMVSRPRLSTKRATMMSASNPAAAPPVSAATRQRMSLNQSGPAMCTTERMATVIPTAQRPKNRSVLPVETAILRSIYCLRTVSEKLDAKVSPYTLHSKYTCYSVAFGEGGLSVGSAPRWRSSSRRLR